MMLQGLGSCRTGLDVGNVVWQQMAGKTGERDVLYSHGQVLDAVVDRLLVVGLIQFLCPRWYTNSVTPAAPLPLT